MIREAAPAKVNLFLQVAGRRPDGYHLLDSLVVFAAVGDVVSATSAPDFSLAIAGDEAPGLIGEDDNLVLRAARALAAAAGVGQCAALHLEKALPVASGIGGGSADAAAALRALTRLWDIPEEVARRVAPQLGADVPACLVGHPLRMTGIGEMIGPAPALPEFGLVLANLRVPVATPDVFRRLAGRFSGPARLPEGWADPAAMAADLARLSNDLEAPAIESCPAIAPVLAALAALPGALLARMSGSGATCFAIMPDASSAARAAALLPASWWRWGGGLAAPPAAPL
ncbi:4-(cytidine 5'-diphospho)-2-C-methyl-D-erythritol kinase [Plastoroseomonas arctica]|uniref:4-(cytidine 5'-diphospho)-2-C-methyl-D-erythritol kinase n=1 Tax=Plastoroseomonas arctica TaxID=1509237 RepID=UPI0034618899